MDNKNIEEAKRRFSLRQVMERLGCGDRYNIKKKVRCPFPGHEDRNPSFSVAEQKNRYTCWSRCGSGDQIDFIQKYLGVSKGEAIKMLCDWAGVCEKIPLSKPRAKTVNGSTGAEAKPAAVERPRIAKLAAPNNPVRYEQWRSVIAANFPTLVRPAEVCASVIAQLQLNDVANPFALALVDVPSSGKTITLNFFTGVEDLIYTTDNFSPASFVSHSSNVKREALEEIDLLPRIRYRAMLVREFNSVLGEKEEALQKSLGILTRVLDGEGLQTDTGVHGRRGYQGDYLFMMLAATTPIAPRVFKAMGNCGSRLFFLHLHTPKETEDTLISQNQGQDRKSREDACKRVTEGFLRTLWSSNPAGVTWNKSGDSKECLRVIARCAMLLAALRAAINVWPVGEAGEKLTHSMPTIEQPNRINCLLYNLARGHALACGRRQLSDQDLWTVLDVTFDSAPPTRAKVFRKLIESEDGKLKASDVVDLLNCSKPTALKEMEALTILGVVDKFGSNGIETEISLRSGFEWFKSDECKALLNLKENAACAKDEQLPAISIQTIEGTAGGSTPCEILRLSIAAFQRRAKGGMKRSVCC